MKKIFVWLCNIVLVTSFPSNYNISELEEQVDYDLYEDEGDVDYYVTVYDSIRDSRPEILTTVERRYKSHKQHHHEDLTPLLSLITQEPHSMTIMMKPNKMEPQSKVRLLYERVPIHRLPNRTHLDHPVMDFVPIIRNSQTYVLNNLPRGKYIVCGEALDQGGHVFQESCFETKISKEDTEGEHLTIVKMS